MTGQGGRPQRRFSDHHSHEEYWTRDEHYRFDDRVAAEMSGVKNELHKLRSDLTTLTTRVTLLIGGLALLGFLINLLAPFLRTFFDIPQP